MSEPTCQLTYEGGGAIQEFEVENADETKDQKTSDQKQQDMGILLRSEGAYSCRIHGLEI